MVQAGSAQSEGAWPDGTVISAVTLNYLVVAGGAGGGQGFGGGGAGGYRASGLQGDALTVDSGSDYTITIGAGGAYNGPYTSPSPGIDGPGNGTTSILAQGNPAAIATTGGGYALSASCGSPWNSNNGNRGGPGGSGGGGYIGPIQAKRPGGAGNHGGYSPPEGNPGGSGGPIGNTGGGGGGGAGATGGSNSGTTGGVGGDGVENLITGVACSAYAGGGGAGSDHGGGGGGAGGSGGGGRGAGPPGSYPTTSAGGTNQGGGGGAGPGAGNGGPGIVVVRSPAGHPMSVSPGTNTVSTVCGQTVAKFTVSGTLTLN